MRALPSSLLKPSCGQRPTATLRHRPSTAALLVAAACGALLATAPAALGATVSVPDPATHKSVPDPERAVFVAEPGEANRLTVTERQVSTTVQSSVTVSQIWTFHDEGAPLTAGEGCSTIDASTATCAVFFGMHPDIDLGDGNDRLAFSTTVLAKGGDGDDTFAAFEPAPVEDPPPPGANGVPQPGFSAFLFGDAGDDTLDATAASNGALYGGPGSDTLNGSRGVDDLGGGPGADRLSGAGGLDHVMGDGGADFVRCGSAEDSAVLDGRDTIGPVEPDGHTLEPADHARRAAWPLPELEIPEPGPPVAAPTPAVPVTVPFAAPAAQVETDCETLILRTSSKHSDLGIALSPATVAGGMLTIGKRLSVGQKGDLQLVDRRARLLGRRSLNRRDPTLALKLTERGRKALAPGTGATAYLRTTPVGGPRSPARGRGTAVELVIAPTP